MYTGKIVLSSRFQRSTRAHGDLKLCEGCEQILKLPLSKVAVQCAFQVSLLNKNVNLEPRVPITIGIIVNLMLHSFSSSSRNCWYLMIFSLSLATM